jgi:pre-mRNA-splicing factor 38A
MDDAVLRGKVFRSRLWKEECFGVDAASLVEKAEKILYVAGVEGSLQKPSHFLCLLFKLFQLAP